MSQTASIDSIIAYIHGTPSAYIRGVFLSFFIFSLLFFILPVITPFHFACYCEDRLRAQAEALDAPLNRYLHIVRRISLSRDSAALTFGPRLTGHEEFSTHVTLAIHLIPQKDTHTALNCFLTCPSEKLSRSFRLLLQRVEDTESEILALLHFLQKAFAPLDYKNKVSAQELSTENPFSKTVEAAPAATATAPAQPKKNTTKKYVFEKDIPEGETVRMRTHDGAYVPDGELPARLRIGKPGDAPIAPAEATLTPTAEDTTSGSAQTTPAP